MSLFLIGGCDLNLHIARERIEDIGAALEHMIYDGLHDQLRGET